MRHLSFKIFFTIFLMIFSFDSQARADEYGLKIKQQGATPDTVLINHTTDAKFKVEIYYLDQGVKYPPIAVKAQDYAIDAGSDATITSCTMDGTPYTPNAGNHHTVTIHREVVNSDIPVDVVVTVKWSDNGYKAVTMSGTVQFWDGPPDPPEAEDEVDATVGVPVDKIIAKSLMGTDQEQSKVQAEFTLPITSTNVSSAIFNGPALEFFAGWDSDPPTTTGKGLLKWVCKRNTVAITPANADSLSLPDQDDCTIAPDGADKTHATLTLNHIGAFDVIVYVDLDNNNSWSAGEEVCVFHLAVIGFGNDAITYDNWDAANNKTFDLNWTCVVGGDGKARANGTRLGRAFGLSSNVALEGGGQNGRLGVDNVDCGWMQNLLPTRSMTIRYTNAKVWDYVFAHPGVSLLDAPSGGGGGGDSGFTSFPAVQPQITNTVDVTIGRICTIKTDDTPTVLFQPTYTFVNVETATEVEAEMHFKTHVCVYSRDFDQNYSFGGWATTDYYLFLKKPAAVWVVDVNKPCRLDELCRRGHRGARRHVRPSRQRRFEPSVNLIQVRYFIWVLYGSINLCSRF